jgi:transglutaminase superfamily protein
MPSALGVQFRVLRCPSALCHAMWSPSVRCRGIRFMRRRTCRSSRDSAAASLNMNKCPYFLTSSTYVRFTGQHVVFLETRGGGYFALNHEDAAQLSTQIAGWPRREKVRAHDGNAVPDSGSLAEHMRSLGILTNDAARQKVWVPAKVEPVDSVIDASESLLGDTAQSSARVLQAYLTAQVVVRLRSLEYVINRIRSRRAQSHPANSACAPTDIAALLASLQRQNDALKLPKCQGVIRCMMQIEYLSHYGVHPTLVLAIRMNPFEKHCWVQYGGVAFFEDIDVLRSYMTILCI